MTSDEIRGKIQYYEQLIAGYIEEKVQREKELEELAKDEFVIAYDGIEFEI